MERAYLCDAVRTPFGRYGGSLAGVRPDDLAEPPLRALLARNPGLDPTAIDDVILGCANQATVNRLCGSSLDAAAIAARGK